MKIIYIQYKMIFLLKIYMCENNLHMIYYFLDKEEFKMTNIIDKIYSEFQSMSQSDQKIAHQVLDNPAKIVNSTISELAKMATVSGASVTRFVTI